MPSIRFIRLPPPVLDALLDDDLDKARALTGVPLTDWFLSDEITWLWRMRRDQIAGDPRAADWIARAAVSVPDGAVVGAGGFHGPPDDAGMVEIGYSTDPAYRRRGYAKAMVTELLRWAAGEPSVVTVRASISPENTASLRTIAGFGFAHVGEQWDEEDGTELLYERPARTSPPAADFYTGIVVEAYAKLKSTDFDPEPYVTFVEAVGQPALEIGCGDGNPLLSVRGRGLDVEGVDSSADMLERCRVNAAALGLDVTLHHQLMQDLSLGRRYRSIYLAGPTFNLLPDDDTAVRALRAIRAHLTDDGAALIPLWIPGPTPADELGVSREATAEDGTPLRYTAVSEVHDETARTRITTTVYERGTERVEREWLLHWYPPDQFRSMCSEAGLHIVSLTDDDGRPIAPEATDFTVTVRRA